MNITTRANGIFPCFRLSLGNRILSRGVLYCGCELPDQVARYAGEQLDCMVFDPLIKSVFLFSFRLCKLLIKGRYYPSGTRFECSADDLVAQMLSIREGSNDVGV